MQRFDDEARNGCYEFSNTGYAKILSPSKSNQSHRRGGRGKSSASMKDEDHMNIFLVEPSKPDTIMWFSNFG